MVEIKSSFEVYAIVKNTRAELFKNLRTGSKIEISFEIKKSWTVSQFKITNLDSKETILKGPGELARCLECFELNEIKE